MENKRKSLGIALLTNGLAEMSPGNSSPLRRRSSFGAPLQKTLSTLSENDDEAERLARRRERLNPLETPQSSSDKRRSLGLSNLAHMPALQISEKINQCIKLCAENKINIKNAFNLEIIDFMTYLIKKQDAEMSNLQVASTSLDVSAKIYGYRVDGVHTDILKMIGGLDKQDKNDDNCNGGDSETRMDAQEGGGDNNAEDQAVEKKKTKRSKKSILSPEESIGCDIEVLNPINLMMGEGDSQTTDLLFQAMLPYHENGNIYLHSFKDVIFDKIPEKVEVTTKEFEFSDVVANSALEICSSFNNFQFLGWSAENEPADEPSPDESKYQFDLDASIPADDPPACHTNLFDIDDDYHEEVNRFERGPNRTENIVDLSNVIATTGQKKNFEYSYLQDSLASHIQWVGPLHWKVRPQKSLTSSRIMPPVGCKDTVRKKKEIVIEQTDEVVRNVVVEKFLPGHAVRLKFNYMYINVYCMNFLYAMFIYLLIFTFTGETSGEDSKSRME